MALFVTAVTVALVVSFLCSIFESVLLSISPARVEALAMAGRRSGEILRHFKQHIDIPIAAILIVNTIAHTIGATVAGASYVDQFSEQTLWVFSVVFTIAVLLFTEIVPKTLGVTFATQLAAPVAHAIHYLTLALRPLVAAASSISRALRGSAGGEAQTSIEEIRLLTAVGRNEGVVGPRTAGIIDSATRLHQLDAADVLLPRSQIVFLSGEQNLDEAIRVMRESGYSRFPFTPTGQLDDISGIVLAKELLFAVQDNPAQIEWPKILRDPLFVPQTKPLNSLLQVFRAERRHMAIVVDEYGSTIGIVTLEDVLEELVGDIIDESDHAIDEIEPQADGSVHALATVELRKLCSRLDVEWDQGEDVVTLGGLVTSLLDRMPQAGDVVQWNELRIEVLEASATTAELLAVRRTTD